MFYYITGNLYVMANYFWRDKISHKINFSWLFKQKNLFYGIIYCDLIYIEDVLRTNFNKHNQTSKVNEMDPI